MASITRRTIEAIVRIERIASKDAHRPTLNAVHFHNNQILASNGHIATSLPFASPDDAETLNGHYLHASDVDYLKATLKAKKSQPGFDLGFDAEGNLTLQGAVFYKAHGPFEDIQSSIVNVMRPPERQLPVTIALNAGYLRDIVQAMDASKMGHAVITFDALKTTSPICVTIPGEDGPRATLMPIRMTDRDDIEQRTRQAAESLPRPSEAEEHTQSHDVSHHQTQ